MKYRLRPYSQDDLRAVVDVFNYYVVNSLTAFPEKPLSYEHGGKLFTGGSGLPFLAVQQGEVVVGFGLLRPYSVVPSFAHTAEITCFIDPGHTGKGIGSEVYGELFARGVLAGVRVVLASIASANAGSIAFHEKMGFTPCGRFEGILRKSGQDQDVVWMQRSL